MSNFNAESLGIQAFVDLRNELTKALNSLPSSKGYEYFTTDHFENPQELKAELTEVNSTHIEAQKEKEFLKKEIASLKKQSNELEANSKIMVKEKTNLENELHRLTKAKISSADELAMRIKKCYYKALQRITQVKFDFPNCKDHHYLKGYFYYLHQKKTRLFSLDITNLSNEEIAEKLYDLMEPRKISASIIK